MRFSALVLFAGILLASCMTMPETKIFSLYLPVEDDGVLCTSELSVHVYTNAPRHLSQPFIMHRTSDYELRMTKYSKWDAAPVDILNATMRQALTPYFRDISVSRYFDRKSYSLAVELKNFERLEKDGALFASLAFDISLRAPDGKELFAKTVNKKEALETGDNLNLAMAMSAALMESVEEIQTDIPIVLTGK